MDLGDRVDKAEGWDGERGRVRKKKGKKPET